MEPGRIQTKPLHDCGIPGAHKLNLIALNVVVQIAEVGQKRVQFARKLGGDQPPADDHEAHCHEFQASGAYRAGW